MKKRKLVTLLVMALLIGSTTAEAMFDAFWGMLVFKPMVRDWFIRGPGDVGTSFANNFHNVICYNPPTSRTLPFMTMLLRILLPIYSLSIVLIGFYLLFVSSSPKGRAKAKSMLSKLIITMVLVSISPQLMEVIFDISRELTDSIFALTTEDSIEYLLTHGAEDMWTMARWLKVPDVELSVIPFILSYVFTWLPYVIISLRNIILTALMILFPLGILFYAIPSLKSIGRTILEQFIVWTSIQAAMALALICTVKAYSVIPIPASTFGGCNYWSWRVPFLWELGLSSHLPLLFCPDVIDLGTFSFGMVAYMMIIVFPMVIVMIFKKFLP